MVTPVTQHAVLSLTGLKHGAYNGRQSLLITFRVNYKMNQEIILNL